MIVALLYQSTDGRRSAGIDRIGARQWRVELRLAMAWHDVHRTKRERHVKTLTKAQSLAREWVNR